MSARGDRLLASVLAAAGAQLVAERALGDLLWSVNGWRMYQRWDGITGALTLCQGRNPVVTYETPGISPADLT